jgi:hypothetical protein
MMDNTYAIAKVTDNIKFENDFGHTAIALARFTKDQGAIR